MQARDLVFFAIIVYDVRWFLIWGIKNNQVRVFFAVGHNWILKEDRTITPAWNHTANILQQELVLNFVRDVRILRFAVNFIRRFLSVKKCNICIPSTILVDYRCFQNNCTNPRRCAMLEYG